VPPRATARGAVAPSGGPPARRAGPNPERTTMLRHLSAFAPLIVFALSSCADGPRGGPAEQGSSSDEVTLAEALPQERAVQDTWVKARLTPDKWGLRTSNNPDNGDFRCVHSADNALWAWVLSWARPAYSLENFHPQLLRELLIDMEYPDERQIRRGWKLGDPSPLCVNKRTSGIPFQPLHGVVEVTAAFGGGDVAKNFIERELDFQAGKIATEQSDSVAFHMLSAATANQIEKPGKYRGYALAAWRELRSRIDRGLVDLNPDEPDNSNTLRHLQITFAMRRTADLLGNLDDNLVQRANALFNKVTYDEASHSFGNGVDRCETEQCFGYYLLTAVDRTPAVEAAARGHRSNRCPTADGKWRYRNKVSDACTGFGSLEATALGTLGDWKLAGFWPDLHND
jgi:hypothetical protein